MKRGTEAEARGAETRGAETRGAETRGAETQKSANTEIIKINKCRA
jgi:hypothetical protein